jgi:hypothetical protein
MNLIENFEITKNTSIEILIPNAQDKFNYYYEATEKLNVFDQLTVLLKQNNEATILAEDMVDITITIYNNMLEKALQNQVILPEGIDLGQIGRSYNLDIMYEISDAIDYSLFSVWSHKNSRTWLYNNNNKMYLEVSPLYPWLYSDLEEAQKEKDFISFDEFMKTYKPIFFGEIPRASAEHWVRQCDKILESIIKPA